ncbi:MAG: MMPL family transporter [Gammaproteobacteria bacterium]|nr:MMPL family transporter [Gammaproteobacteria bacterium]
METLARFVIRRRAIVLWAYGLLMPVALLLAGSVLPMLVAGGFEDPDRESWQAFEVMQREFGTGTGDIIALYTPESGTVDDIGVKAGILAAISRLEADPAVGAVMSLYTTDAQHFASHARDRTFVAVDLKGSEQEKIEAYLRLRPLFGADGLTAQFGGLIPTNHAVFETIRRDLTRAELLAFPLTALAVFLVFGSAASVGVLLAAGACGIVIGFAALRVIVAFEDVSVFAINTITLLGLGLAIDYSLFLVNRFREELETAGVEAAIVRTMQTTGRAVAFSGLTVAASLCGLFVFEQMLLRSLALGGILVTIGTVVLALTLVPALLAVLGGRIDAWRTSFLAPAGSRDTATDPWRRMAVAVMRQPLVAVVGITALLILLAQPFSRFSGTIVDWRMLPEGEPVRVTNELLATEFTPNQHTPHVVLAMVVGDVLDPANLEALSGLAERMASIPGIVRIDSAFTFLPDLTIAETTEILADRDPENAVIGAVLGSFVSGPYMRYSLVSSEPFDDPRSQEQVVALRALSMPGMEVRVAGYAAALTDLRDAIHERAPWMIAIVMGVMFLVLLLAFGSVTLPLKAMAMTMLSLTASFGAIVWIFQDGRLTGLLGYVPLGFSDATLPLVMFAVVFGLSMDYEIILLSRVREEYEKCGDNAAAVAAGLAATGRLITSAGLLFLVVVIAFATSEMVIMKALGAGMALAILLDITVVRAMLVPAAMCLMGRWNWYAPAPLRRLLRAPGGDLPRH